MKPPRILLVLLLIVLCVLVAKVVDAQSYQQGKYKHAPSINKVKVQHEWIVWNKRVIRAKRFFKPL